MERDQRASDLKPESGEEGENAADRGRETKTGEGTTRRGGGGGAKKDGRSEKSNQLTLLLRKPLRILKCVLPVTDFVGNRVGVATVPTPSSPISPIPIDAVPSEKQTRTYYLQLLLPRCSVDIYPTYQYVHWRVCACACAGPRPDLPLEKGRPRTRDCGTPNISNRSRSRSGRNQTLPISGPAPCMSAAGDAPSRVLSGPAHTCAQTREREQRQHRVLSRESGGSEVA